MTARVLVIDDDAAFRFAMTKALRRLGYTVSDAASGEQAVPLLTATEPPDVALLDLRMRGIGGLQVLQQCAPLRTRVIVLTGHGTVKAAVQAMRLGAFSFLEKPVDADMLRPLLEQALTEKSQAALSDDAPIPVVGTSTAMAEVRRFIETVAPTDETVTILGETGTGKEVVARQVHAQSRRATGPFVAMNAACVPRELFESELFGHVKGAFTGAQANRPGLFREAEGGTLFIDELAELPADSQAKLLRAIETKSIRSVGASGEDSVDVRIVAATNQDLWRATQDGSFRRDLYFRLQVFPMVIPPLRARPEDIAGLSTHLLERLGKAHFALQQDAVAALQQYDWPGNVRELLNVLRRASLFATTNEIGADLVTRMITASVFGHARADQVPGESPNPNAQSSSNLADMERQHIERVLNEHNGNITHAATALGIDRRTLQRKLKGYGLDSGD